MPGRAAEMAGRHLGGVPRCLGGVWEGSREAWEGMQCCFAECFVHGAHACMLSCGVLLMLAFSCRFSLTTLAGLHVAMLFEWCVQDLPSGHSREQEEGREGTAKEKLVEWAEQFPRE
jgi:hypothetical protein